MLNTGKLANRTAFISGASRGIGKAIALKLARDGANIIIAAKTAQPHPKLPGTIYTAAKEVEEAGGKCLPCIVDIRYEDQVLKAVDEGVRKFGGIDIVVNNASAISLTGTEATDMKRFDLMHGINLRGTFLVSKCCIPYLRKGKNPHILNISPPLNMKPIWFKNHVAYTMAKYGMSMCVLGMAEELRNDNIAVNALWPKSAIQTAAMVMLSGGQEAAGQWRKPEIVADSAYVILTKDSRNFTGNFCIDEQVLKDAGVTDFDQYAVVPGQKLMPDFFLDEAISEEIEATTSSTSSTVGVDGVFNTINAKLSETLVSEVKATYEFVLSGEENGTWFLDLKNNKGATGKGKSPSEPDVIFTMDSNDFHKMFSGKLNTTTAFMVGKLKIQGNMGKAMKLSNLLKQMISKL